MISLESKTFCNYYGSNPSEYELKFIHYNIDVADNSEDEYNKIRQDLKKIYEFDKKAFIIYFSNVENYNKIINYINIHEIYKDKIYLRVRDINEYREIQQSSGIKGIKIIVDLSDICKFNITDLDLVIQVDNISELSITRLKELLEKYRIKEILLGQISYLTKDYEYLYEIMSKMYDIDSSKKTELEKINKITNDIYSIEEFIKISSKFEEILNKLNIQNQLDGCYKIFNYIARTVSYDEDGVLQTKIENQNLIGSVLNGKSVCEGYSKYLQQLLSLIGVHAIAVGGGGNKEEGGHVWNQVRLNDKWYNADVTVASYCIDNNEEISTYLVKDDKLLYKATTSNSHKCDENFEEKITNLSK